jgi:hypothetical protein
MGWFGAAGRAQAEKRVVRPAWCLTLHFAGDPMRLWAGKGPLTIGGNTYRGMGEWNGIPAMKQLINGQAARATFGFSGVDVRCAALAAGDRDKVFGRKITVALGMLDEAWQPIAAPFVLWRGRMETVTADEVGRQGDAVARANIAVEAVTMFAARRRSNTVLLSDSQQRRRHPGDRFCERTDLYRFSNKDWP